MLLQDLQKDIIVSLKAGDGMRVETLRFLVSAVKNSGIAKYGAETDAKLNDADVVDVIKKQVKSHRESVDAFEKAGRNELAAKEKSQLVILEAMLPKEMSDEELKKIVINAVKTGETNFGKLMGLVMREVNGNANGNRVSQMVKQQLE